MARPTSRLIVLSPDPGPIDLVLVRPQLDPDRHDVAEVESDAEHLLVEVDGIEHDLTVVPAPALHPWHFEQPRWAEGERALTDRATHAVLLESRLDDPPLAAFKSQLAVAAALFDERAPAVYDEAAARLLPGHQVRRLAHSSVTPGARELFSIHSVGAAQGSSFWVHTHGLARAGVPELDLLGVPPDGRALAADLLDGTAALLLAHGVPPEGSPFPVGEGLDLVLLPVAQAAARLGKDEPGRTRDADHEADARLVLAPADARRGGSPSVAPLLGRITRGVIFQTPEETERARVLAKERWPELERLFREHGADRGWVFLVKLGYETDRARERQEDVAREHLWFRVRALEPGRVEAALESAPLDVAALAKGDVRWHDLARLSDWLVVPPGEGRRIDPQSS